MAIVGAALYGRLKVSPASLTESEFDNGEG